MAKAAHELANLENPDVAWLPNGDLRLTLVIDKINSGYDGVVTIEGQEATYEERRTASYASDGYIGRFPDKSRAQFTVPLQHAKGYGIGSIVTLTISKV